MRLHPAQIKTFQHELWTHYDKQARHELPWRLADSSGSLNPYHVWVSELMLQQTQVTRVIPKYLQFLELFPTVETLARASLGDVLIAWQGLGYNRRAKFLWQAANQIVQNDGIIPSTVEELVALPGIGKNTAGAIVAYAFNKPAVFVETNVRTVFFHHFFPGKQDVTDKEIVALVEQTIDRDNPREFYWAIMDYGTELKRRGVGKITQSKHYTRQSKFEGSSRQVRGKIIRLLGSGPQAESALLDQLADTRAPQVLAQLVEESMIQKSMALIA